MLTNIKTKHLLTWSFLIFFAGSIKSTTELQKSVHNSITRLDK